MASLTAISPLGLESRSQWLGNELVGFLQGEYRRCPTKQHGPAENRAVILT